MKVLGNTIQDFMWVFFGHLGGGRPPAGKQDRLKAVMMVIVSLTFLFVGSYLVMATTGKSQTLGGSLLGTVAGYWLK
ncbi:MAG TPA: hypothetical protein VM008_08530 [Phycisphaerae bacterium]|nr:hypothetical protein [Phycisphaerae bacterium]